MNINGFSNDAGVQGVNAFDSLSIEKKERDVRKMEGDQVSISPEAQQLYAAMRESGQDPSSMSPEELQAFLAENPEAASLHEAYAEGGERPQGPTPSAQGQEQSGQQQSSGDGQGGKGGQGGQGGSGSASTDDTTTQTSLEAEIQAVELQIAQAEQLAEESGNDSQVEELKAQLADLEDELEELTESA